MRNLSLFLFSSTFFCFSATAANVEVTLIDNLDGNLSSYCIDIVGGGQNIDPKNGLQAHTCYSYRGALGDDQAIDSDLIEKGIFNIVAFDVCATMPSTNAGQKVALTSCNASDRQRFVFGDSGTISPKTAPAMCLTVGETTTFGRNGTSPHQIKDLTLETCSEDRAAYQQWRTRQTED